MDEPALEEFLSRPMPASVEAMRKLEGDLLILGAGGKMGPSLARLARRSADEAGKNMRVVAVSRFSSAHSREELEQQGIETIACDLLEESARRQLPQFENVLLMVGHKFSSNPGSRGDPPGAHWAMNTYLPGLLARRFRDARIVCFSSGNVYPFTRLGAPAPTERTPCDPVGEYANSVLGRERMLEFTSARHGTRGCLLRLNYAVEVRYGVLVDIAQKILHREPIPLSVPEVNFVWQGYANRIALQAFSLAKSPPEVLNVTGRERHRVRDLAAALGRRLGVEPILAEPEGDRSLLSDAGRCVELFGEPELTADDLLDLVAGWLLRGGRTLGKPTKFQVTDGRF